MRRRAFGVVVCYNAAFETGSSRVAEIEASETEAGLQLDPLRRAATLGEQAAASLRTALRQGRLLPGERLTTRTLAATLGVSLTPAREALNRLAAERVLALGADRTAMVPILSRGRYEELCLIRLELEGLAALHACPRMGPEHVDRLETLLVRHGKAFAARNAKQALKLNEDFHFTIYAASEMPALVQILETLWLQVGPSMNFLFPSAFDAVWKGGENHRRMIEAIRMGDAAALALHVRHDLKEGRVRLLRVLPEAVPAGDEGEPLPRALAAV
jgi:DNA-binding GntR family transcriptional regulator